jgi:hypothetical protein
MPITRSAILGGWEYRYSFPDRGSPAAIRGWVRTRGFHSRMPVGGGPMMSYADWPLAVTWLSVTAAAAVFYFAPVARLLGA